MSLLGRANWWLPGWLDRLLPHLDVDGRIPNSAAPATAGQPELDSPNADSQGSGRRARRLQDSPKPRWSTDSPDGLAESATAADRAPEPAGR